jgi:hypothetical protein
MNSLKAFLFLFSIVSLSILSAGAIAQLPTDDEFRPVPQFPQPADGAFAVVGTVTNSGILILWDGDAVYSQEIAGGADLTMIAQGYLGDPGFCAISPNQNMLLLGTGFGTDGTNQKLYLINLNNPVDFEEGDGIAAPDHFSGAFLNNSLVILDRGKDDSSGTELIVVDTTPAPTRSGFVTVLTQPENFDRTRQQVIDKPEDSYSSKVFVDRNRNHVYSMDSNTRTLHRFDLPDVINAFDKMTPLDWDLDGTPIGSPGDLFSGGVSGISSMNDLIVGGSSGFGSPGGVQIAANIPDFEILTTLDPAGTQPFYNVIYNANLDEIIAIDATFGQPLVAYARDTGIAPIPAENPCEVEEMILEQYDLLITDFPDLTDDIDADMIPDAAMLDLFLFVSCRVTDEAVVDATHNAYDQNLEILDDEANAALVEDYREILATLLSMNEMMKSSLIATLSNNGITLTGDYISVTCSDTENCLPEFVEDDEPDVTRQTQTRAANEPYSGSGDLDGDATTNLDEYLNVIAIGGDNNDFSVAAFSDRLDGTGAVADGGSGGGSCLIGYLSTEGYMGIELNVLRNFRNEYLLTNPIGTWFASVYYQISPGLVQGVENGRPAGAPFRTVVLLMGAVVVLCARSKIGAGAKRLFKRAV